MKGYIALISILIILAVLVTVILSASQLGIGQSKMVLQKDYSSQVFYFTQACAEEALIKLKENLGYRGGEALNINGNSCNILTVEGSQNRNRVVKVSGSAFNLTKKIKIEIDRVNPEMKIRTWQEVADF